MQLIIIRHGDPIYNPDSLTEYGHKQAAALAPRMALHGLDQIYCSPRLRAKQTAQPTCEMTGLDMHIEDWTDENLAWRQFSVGEEGSRKWCFAVPAYVLRQSDFAAYGEQWYEHPLFAGCEAKAGWERICNASDEFLARLGYRRDGNIYRIERPNNDRVAVFCHSGFGTTWLAHLLGIEPYKVWSSFRMTTTGVTELEFHNYDSGLTAPVCQIFSDVSHEYREGLEFKHNRSTPL